MIFSQKGKQLFFFSSLFFDFVFVLMTGVFFLVLHANGKEKN